MRQGPALPVPVRQGPVGDSLTAFIIAPPYTRPQCRPPRRTMASIGVMAQMFCDAGDSGTQFTTATPPHPGLDGGFCSIRSLPSACRRRVAPLMVQFPPFGDDVTGRQVTHGSPYGATPPRLLSVRPRFGAAPPTRIPSDPRARRGTQAASTPRRTAPLNLSVHTRPRVRPHVRSHAGHLGVFIPPR